MSEIVRVIPFDRVRMRDLPEVGGKNASLGEMIGELSQAGIRVPGGFATTAAAFREFLAQDDLAGRIERLLEGIDVADVPALREAGTRIRDWILAAPLPPALLTDIEVAYTELARGHPDASFAVRSSATAEDLPDASFAGQQDTLLNIRGLHNIVQAISHIFASVYNDRAIAYRAHHGFRHADVALSVGVQRMVRSDKAAAGVMFTLDTESGFAGVVFITSAYGLGESVVQGSVNPDEFYVYKRNLEAGRPAVLRKSLGSKASRMIFGENAAAGSSTRVVAVPESERRRFSLTDEQAEALARNAVAIERHYGRPMDIEWALDGDENVLYILQARPETVKSRDDASALRRYRLKSHGASLASGRAIGQKIGQGTVRLVRSSREMDRVQQGDVLVTELTDPDWEPVMKRASAIVTDRGGRTCHAAIIARELGVPAVVGCGDATATLEDGKQVTVSCAEGDTGNVYAGLLDVETIDVELDRMPASPTKIMMNVGNPELAFEFCQLPNEGVGLARLEFIINRNVGIHPKALLEFHRQPPDVRRDIEARIAGYASP
ncbi:MAG TPA: phosphoenolpyruvate synthase, partial [Casimicrobiaceae bacterium]|nr:phosphoenolpyruvate synthase [Casimicrobiaceae bacterium]